MTTSILLAVILLTAGCSSVDSVDPVATQDITAQRPVLMTNQVSSIVAKPTGLADAQQYQRRFREETGLTVPIIYVALPQSLSAKASFTYRANDQTQ